MYLTAHQSNTQVARCRAQDHLGASQVLHSAAPRAHPTP
eukprot:COSAG01_NODE_30730_length_610_cov_1.677104_1_plen_38_part_10